MHGVILAAGEGSRMGPLTAEKPKAFLEIEGRTLYERQRDALSAHVDALTVVLGYEADRVADDVEADRTVVFEEWREYENAESLRRALLAVGDDDVLVLNGDVLVAASVVGRLVEAHDALSGDSVVGCLPGSQAEHTAVRYDEDGVVTNYGTMSGRRHAGIGIVDRRHRPTAERILRANARSWYPVVYPVVDTRRVLVPPARHLEINRPAHLRAARDRLPLDASESPA